MKTTTWPLTTTATTAPSWAGPARLAGFWALTKPRLTAMVLVTVATGFVLGARGGAHPLALLAAVIGTGLVAGGAGALNMAMERERDRLMRRTANRPVPTGLVSPLEATAFGLALAGAGLGLLAAFANLSAAWLAFATLALYVGAYTPLKSRTTLNTLVGAVPGALPPVIGWVAATGRLGVEALALFLILFLWQFPHFLAIAWMHRHDYERAGHKMLPSVDPTGAMTGRQAAAHALALLPVGALPAAIGLAGPLYLVAACALGAFYLAAALKFMAGPSDLTAKRLLRASLVYLPLVLLMLLVDPLPA